jgi:hypothetical protein
MTDIRLSTEGIETVTGIEDTANGSQGEIMEV